MGEAGEIADFGDNRRSNDRPDPLQCLKRTHKPGPGRQLDCLFDLGLEFQLAPLLVFQRVEISLKRDLLCWMSETAVAQPHAMSMAPSLADEAKIVAQQESLYAGSANVSARRVTGAD